ncbi:MAG: magnesium transporter [Bacteroidetes bacterium RIFCSPLOWO2_12_FULL_31_6]|nr:MAG: magnesium transporter [Bacteroidetes bacterium RIFCSPLOWO2_12_FULL_31_6]
MHFELTKEYLDQLNIAVESNVEAKVLELIEGLHPVDIAEILQEQTIEEAKAFYFHLPEELGADALVELDEDVRERFLNEISSKDIAGKIINQLDSDDAADVIGELSEIKQDEVISHIEDIDKASHIIDLLHYHEDSAGGLMAKELVKVNIDWDIATCIKEIRTQSEGIENMYTVYVVDDMGALKGRISLKKLILANESKKVKDIYDVELMSVKVDTDNEQVAQIMEKYDLVVVPVIDEIGRLLGRITIDDVVDVMREEAEKDYQMASGISENVESSDSAWILTRARLPWLLVGLLGGIMSSKIIGTYESQIQIHPETAFFIPLIGAMGGNTGTQASALIVQGLANNSLGLKKGIWSQLFKEINVGLINGIVCSGIIFLFNFFFSDNFSLAITVSTALMSVIFFAGIFGTVVPLLLNKYKIDPALATGPFVTTTNDIFGTFLYFYIGHLMYAIA